MKRFCFHIALALLAVPAWCFWWAAHWQSKIHTSLATDKGRKDAELRVSPERGVELFRKMREHLEPE